MTARVNDAIDTILTSWATLTPPTDPALTYRHLSDDEETDDATADRGFWVRAPEQGEIIGEAAGATAAIVEWAVSGVLVLDTKRYGRRDQARAVADEGGLFVRAVDRITAWPAGVREVITGPLETLGLETEDGDELLVIEMPFTILCEETD